MNTFNTFQKLITNNIVQAATTLNAHTLVHRESVYAYLEEGVQNTTTQNQTFRFEDSTKIHSDI
jgi:hypothetical protein